jgi:hypothetical protein
VIHCPLVVRTSCPCTLSGLNGRGLEGVAASQEFAKTSTREWFHTRKDRRHNPRTNPTRGICRGGSIVVTTAPQRGVAGVRPQLTGPNLSVLTETPKKPPLVNQNVPVVTAKR